MSDERHDCPSRVVPFLIGGALGAALASDANWENAAQIRREIDKVAALERERLAQEQKRLALAQTEAQRHEADRVFRHAVLWLEHCTNDERLDWLVSGHGAALADEVATRAIADARKRADVVALFDDVRAAKHALDNAEADKRRREIQRDELRRRRWQGAGVWWVFATIGFAILIPFWVRFGAKALGAYGLLLAVSAFVAPLIVRWQPTPKDLALQIPGFLFSGSLREGLVRIESAIGAAKTAISTASLDLALAREAVVQTFRALRPGLIDDANHQMPRVRAQIDGLQSVYPPRVRCELAAVSDAALHARLAPHLPAALERGVAAIV